ncbi:MAG: veratrol--corrinoid protein metyltransferase [Clostridiales bacterium]|nr:veratrol--corrinoid protein metyltransferase [Clostridiales bacterium]
MKMTEKENFMMFMRGEQPAWVPRYGMGQDPYSEYPPAVMTVTPEFINERRTPQGGFDIWGVEYVATAETGGMALPVPNKFILDDITRWRDVIKAPDISHIDWEAAARKSLANIDREQSAVVVRIHLGYFQTLMAFMGFTEGLCAMLEEPDEVLALFDYMCGFYTEVNKKCLEYFRPDFVELTDDTAAARNPFISADMYRRLVKPFHIAEMRPAVNAGLPVMKHNCGRCEDFIDDWFDIGVTAWNPAQVENDLDGIKKKYGNRLGLCGCWDTSGPVNWPGASEETVRQAVRDCIDRFAPGGGFCFRGGTLGPRDDPDTMNKRRWISEEYDSYGRTFYD